MARKKKFAPNDNNLAIAYYRFSSHSQNDASIDQQRELAHEWADAHGFKIVQEYEDAATSGTTDARPGFQQMLSEVAKIRPHTLIMWKTDRLGRDKYVLAMAKKKIRDAGCEIHLLAEHIPTEGPEGVLIEGLMEAMAEYYSRQLSQNIQRGMDYNAQHALYNGHRLFGYEDDPPRQGLGARDGEGEREPREDRKRCARALRLAGRDPEGVPERDRKSVV